MIHPENEEKGGVTNKENPERVIHELKTDWVRPSTSKMSKYNALESGLTK